jgi:hypothetical protein
VKSTQNPITLITLKITLAKPTHPPERNTIKFNKV